LLKVLQIANKAPVPPDDGSSIAVYNMTQGLLQNGAEVHLMAINTKKHFKPESFVPAEFKKQANYISVPHDTNPDFFGAIANLFTSQSYFVSRFYFKEFETELIKKLQEVKFDIVQLEGLFMAVYIDVIKKYSKAKVVLRAHNVEYLIWERHLKNEKFILKNKYLQLQTQRLKKFEMAALQKVDAVVSITNVDKAVFQGLCNKPVFNCISGVDISQYISKSMIGFKEKTVFYFGSMDWLPNQQAVDWFLKNCWMKISEAVPDATFVIAGKNMPDRFLKINERNVMVVPKVADSKDFYCQHDIMIVPLLSGSGLRIKIIEGMAYGKPIVSTSIGAEGIDITNGTNILIANYPSDFISAVIDLLQHPEKKENMGREAQAFAKVEFDNKQVVSSLISFYSSLNV